MLDDISNLHLMICESNGTNEQDRKLRSGYTTGTCAAAASKAAAMMIFSQKPVNSVTITTPNGIELILNIEDMKMTGTSASCAVRKDGGDDIDATHGALIYSSVTLTEKDINIDGGEGVGRVTKKGVDQPVGNAAINRIPRKMITECIQEISSQNRYTRGFAIVISVPEGLEISKRTFNSRLGIVGGISIIGTSGIVEPMSEKAMIDTMRVEMKVHMGTGEEYLIAVPGNYGKDFLETYPDIPDESAIKCSNFIGEALDSALEFNAKGILFVGNLGKLVKVAGGIMNTHSKYADCRMEILASASVTAGLDIRDIKKILDCITTDDALDIIHAAGKMGDVCKILSEKTAFHLDNRVRGKIETAAIVFSSKYGKLFETENAKRIIKERKV